MNVIFLCFFFIGLADCLNHSYLSLISRTIRFTPIYASLVSSFSIFLYLLPGLCDPELNDTKRLPFVTLHHFIFALLIVMFFNFNGLELLNQGSNGLVLLFPVFFSLTS